MTRELLQIGAGSLDCETEKLHNQFTKYMPSLETFSQKEIENLPLIVGANLSSIAWQEVLPYDRMLETDYLESFLNSQPNLLQFFKEKNVFESIIAQWIRKNSEGELDKNLSSSITKIKKLHPELNMRATCYYGGYKEKTVGFERYGGQAYLHSDSFIEIAFMREMLNVSRILIKHGAKLIDKKNNPDNPYSLIKNPDFFEQVLKQYGIKSYLNSFNKSHLNSNPESYELFHKVDIMAFKNILNRYHPPSQHKNWDWNTIDSAGFLELLKYAYKDKKAEEPDDAVDYLHEIILANPDFIDKPFEKKHAFKHLTLRQSFQEKKYQLLINLIEKIDNEKEIKQKITTSNSIPKIRF